MACVHKFAQDLTLQRLNFLPTTLIIGTFNPSWESLANVAAWFYGRTQNNYFWDVLPRLYENSNLRQSSPVVWKAFCKRQQIALTDLLYSIDDADSDNPDHVHYLRTYQDDAIVRHFHCFTEVDILAILENNPTITHIYLTRHPAGYWQKRWLPIVRYCEERGKTARHLLTPSAGARFKMQAGTLGTLSDFIFKHWQDSWHDV